VGVEVEERKRKEGREGGREKERAEELWAAWE
jgi:hypothetical protein